MSIDFLGLSKEAQISAIYIAYFGRAPDPDGIDFWVGEYNAGLAAGKTPDGVLDDISESFRLSDEAQTLFPFFADPPSADRASIEDFVIDVYGNLFNRKPSAAGLQFWADETVERLDQGINIGDILIDIISGAQDGVTVTPVGGSETTVNDATAIQHKIDVGGVYAEQFAASDRAWNTPIDLGSARAVVEQVGVEPDTVEAAEAAVDAVTGQTDGIAVQGSVLQGDAGPVSDLANPGGPVEVGRDAPGFLGVTGATGLRIASDGFDNIEVGSQPAGTGTMVVSGPDTSVTTTGTDNTVQVGRHGEGTLLVERGASMGTLQFEVARNGSGTATITGAGTTVLASNDEGLFSGEFSDDAGFVRAGRNAGSDGRIEILDGATMTVRPGAGTQTSDPGIVLGQNADSRGELLVNGGNLEIAQDTPLDGFGPFFGVGSSGVADATILGGGTVNLNGPEANVIVAQNPGAEGHLTVSGADSRLVHAGQNGGVFVGGFGELETAATLTVAAGAELATNNLQLRGSDARASIRGEDSQVSVTVANGSAGTDVGAFLRVASGDGENAALDVTEGAELQVTSQEGAAAPGIQVARDPGSVGTLQVDGEGARLALIESGPLPPEPSNFGPFLQFGRSGEGRGTISNGAEVRVQGPNSLVTVSRGNADEFSDPTDAPDLARSSLQVLSGGRLIIVGEDSQDQEFTSGLEIGARSNADGSVRVAGEGSLLKVDGNVDPFVNVGFQGTGDLTIADGGRMEARFLDVGDQAGSTGTMTVEGTDSTVAIFDPGDPNEGLAAGTNIGRAGNGTLDISDGGTFTLAGGSGIFPFFSVGTNESGVGTVTISGGQSSLTISGDNVGPGGQSGQLMVGRFGEGTLNIADGATVSSDDTGATLVGRESTGTGSIAVEGDGSTLNAGAEMIIGADFDFEAGEILFDQGGTGTVTVGDGGTLRAGAAEGDGVDDIFIGAGGTLQVLDGGTLIGDVRNEGGTFEPGNSPGEVAIQGDLDQDGALTFEFAGHAAGAFDHIEVAGEAALAGEVTLAFDPAFAVEAGDSFQVLTAGDGLRVADDLEVAATGLGAGLHAALQTGPAGLQVSVVADDGLA